MGLIITKHGPSSQFFTEFELACPCCGVNGMSTAFIDKLTTLRKLYYATMSLSSAYRCPHHNQAVSTTGETGPHTTGRAVDVRCSGGEALRLIDLALGCGFTGIGVSQKGNRTSRFIHLDDLPDSRFCPRPWVWSY